MKITGSPTKSSRKHYVLLSDTPLRQRRPLRAVGSDRLTTPKTTDLVGLIIKDRKYSGLRLHFTASEPFGLKSSAYNINIMLEAQDLGALVEAATGDPLLADHVRRKSLESGGAAWLLERCEDMTGDPS